MPIGIYERKAKHIAICKRAGIASNKSHARLEHDTLKHVYFICAGCNEVVETVFSRIRLYCSKSCMIKALESNSYAAIHNRVRKLFGKPKKCENCDTETARRYEWANITGVMEVARENWRRLCCRCHRRLDQGIKNKIEIA